MSGCYCELMLTCSSGIVRQHGPHHTQTLSPAHLLYSRSIWFWLKPVSSWMAMMSSGCSWRDDLELPMVMVSGGECCYQGGWRDSDSPAAAYCSHTTLSTTAATLQIGDKAGPSTVTLHTTLTPLTSWDLARDSPQCRQCSLLLTSSLESWQTHSDSCPPPTNHAICRGECFGGD